VVQEFWQPFDAATFQYDAGGYFGECRTAAYRHPEIGRGEGRAVVETVSCEHGVCASPSRLRNVEELVGRA
jgi:hypothetical protein